MSKRKQNKQALRDFQNRLAERLQAANAAEATASWLAVEAGALQLLLPLTHAGEIFSWTDVQKVPYVQPWFLGVSNLRGGLYGLIDLALFMGNSQSKPRTEIELSHCRLVTFNPVLETNGALLVDRLIGLRTSEDFSSSDEILKTDALFYFSTIYTDFNGQQWQEVNLQLLSQHQQFLGIGA
ncbi:chemotaxis protein CheW [Ottowia sp.]|uniref:chemotaxis protein CheW n=1 Tax=Ottowia sp. TaxID=1898956 RepID=UPI003A84241A